MTALQRQVQRTQRRLWTNRWLHWGSWSATAALGAFAVVVLLAKMFDWAPPWGWIGLGLLASAVTAATIGSLVRRPDDVTAAAALDQAAGLRERISSGLHCAASDDPYARAVVVDAEHVSQSVTVRKHIPLRAPKPVWYAGLGVVVAGILLSLPSGWFQSDEVLAQEKDREIVERRQVEVKKRIEQIRKDAKSYSTLASEQVMKDLVADLEKVAQQPFDNPEARRHEAQKRIDRAADAIKKQQAGEKFDKVSEMKKMLRGIKTKGQADTPAQRLAQALAEGDFKAANEAVKTLQSQLASMKDSEKSEATQKMQEQIARLSKQLDQLSNNSQLQNKLKQAGLSKKDAERLAKKVEQGDTKELEKALKKSGMSQPQIDSLMSQIQKRAAACSACRNMSGALSQAAASLAQGQTGDAASNLQGAGGQLSEMEQLEQEMNELESALAGLQQGKDGLNSCPACNGTGMVNGMPCSQCQGGGMKPGAGLGKLGRGRGGLAPEQPTNVAFKMERTKVYTGPGAIIGRFLIDGEQVKGEATKELVEVITAEERNATDAINRDRIPRQYQKSVKDYFARVQKVLGNAKKDADEPESDTNEQGSDGQDDSGS
jgi:hypothetical protein